MFSVALGNSVSMRFRSCENKLVTTPVSVVLKKRSGALIRVWRAFWCKLAPAFLMETIQSAMPSRSSDIRAQPWNKAYIPA